MLTRSKSGRLRLRIHRPLAGTPKTVTISREADGWYASFSCAEVPVAPLPATGHETGIDVGLQVFRVTADGEAVENPRHYRHAERALRTAQRRVARRTPGSHRRRTAVQLLTRHHQTVQRQRGRVVEVPPLATHRLMRARAAAPPYDGACCPSCGD